MTRMHLDVFARGFDHVIEIVTSSRLGAIALGLGESPGLAVAGAYLALWAAGLWRSEPTWIDRAGRALGWFWILAALAFIVLPFEV
jgi:hypothetical protein